MPNRVLLGGLAGMIALAAGLPETTTRPVATRPAVSAEEVEQLAARLQAADQGERLAAVEALGKCDVPRARQALMTARRDASRPVSLAAYRALVSLRAPEFLPAILEALYEGDEAVRLMAIPWVAEVRPRRASAAITGLLIDEASSEAIRLAAARALGDLREEVGIPALAATLNARDLPPTVTDAVRAEAANALGILGGPFAIDELLRAARGHRSEALRARALVALAPYAAQPRPGPAIIKAAQSADTDTRAQFLRAHRQSGRGAETVFRKFVSDADWSVRVEAAAGLCALGNIEGIDLLIEALGGGDATARSAAHEVLVKCTGQAMPPEADPWRAWWAGARATFRWPGKPN